MKIEAEEACWDFHRRGLPLSVLRPTIVYGPFSKYWSIRFATRILSGSWGNLGAGGTGKCNLIYVDDLAMAAIAAVERDSAVGEAFNVNGDDDVTWNEYWERFAAALGRPGLPSVNYPLMRMRSTLATPVRFVARNILTRFRDKVFNVYQRSYAARGAMQATERSLSLTPSLDELRLFRRDCRFANDKLKTRLGFTPRVDLEQGLQATAAWLNHHGFTPGGSGLKQPAASVPVRGPERTLAQSVAG